MERPDAIAQMRSDAVLAAPPRRRQIDTFPRGLLDAQCVLLTGVTGFLGRWLAAELLSASEARLVCLARPRGRDAAAFRVWQSLARTGIDRGTLEARVTVVDGDLGQPAAGLSEAALSRIASDVQAICHAAADVNWVKPYPALRTANVEATRELLHLALRRSLPFHFVSSLAVCYAAGAPETVNSDFNPLEHLHGMHLGYAQTKAVAESLVLAAGRAGLPVSIYRPSLIAGHSRTGAFNRDDIIARVIAGCLHMGMAPDLDWTLDCLPVDVAAKQIVRCSARRGIHHLLHGHPRHWRECLLWMRLRGYDVRLVPFNVWLRQVETETDGDPGRLHPLRPLRTFFKRPSVCVGRTVPEALLQSRPAIVPAETNAPMLDAALLDRYFDAYAASGTIRPAVLANRPALDVALDERYFSDVLGLRVHRAIVLDRLSEHSIVSDLTGWRAGRATGLFRCRLTLDEGDVRVIVKVKPPDTDVIAVGEALARLCEPRVGDAYARWADRLGLVRSPERELAVYRQSDPRFVAHAPRAFGTSIDPVNRVCTLILEEVRDERPNAGHSIADSWSARAIDCAIHGLAALHAIWWGRGAELRRTPWIGPVVSTAGTTEMSDLWEALGAHARPSFVAWTDAGMSAIQRQILGNIDTWKPVLESQTQTLVHNDFNPRNLCLRRDGSGLRLAAFDWELATIGAPQRDLAELLCFVLPLSASTCEIDLWIERHRVGLMRECGVAIDSDEWIAGFRAALCDLMLDRLPMYALIHRVRPQSFLPRVVRTWRRLHARFERRRFRSSDEACA